MTTQLTDGQRELAAEISRGTSEAFREVMAEMNSPQAQEASETPTVWAEVANLLEDAAPGSVIAHNGVEVRLPASASEGDGGSDGETAEMAQAILAPYERQLVVNGIPVGSIVVGGVTGVVAAEVINGLVDRYAADSTVDDLKPNFANVAWKAGAIFGLQFFGQRVMSRSGVLTAQAVIAAQVFTDVFPLDKAIDKIVGWFDKDEAPVEQRNRFEQPASVPQGGSYSASDPLRGVLG